MKKFILLQLLSLLVFPCFSQLVDERLLIKFSESELLTMIDEESEKYQYYLDCLDYGCYLANYEVKKAPKEIIGELELKAISEINFFSLDIEPVSNKYLYFKLKGFDKMLVIRSIEHIKMEASKKK